jgi:hypothetical protein
MFIAQQDETPTPVSLPSRFDAEYSRIIQISAGSSFLRQDKQVEPAPNYLSNAS